MAITQGAQLSDVKLDSGSKNLVAGGSLISGAFPASEYLYMFTGRQVAGQGAAHATVKQQNTLCEIYPSALTGRGTLTDAQMWANPGWISTTTGAGGQAEIPLGQAPMLFNQYYYLFSTLLKGAAPAAVTPIIGQGNPSTSKEGLCLRADTSGKVQVLYITAGVAVNLGTSAGVFLDGSQHMLSIWIAPTGHVTLFLDGEIDTHFPPNNAAPIGSITESQPFTFGGAAASSGAAIAVQFAGIHCLKFSTPPLNIGQMVKILFTDSYAPLPLGAVVYPSKVIGCYWGAAQSNEAGKGNSITYTGSLGIPHKDSASGRSIIPSLSASLAQRGVAALWATTAFGSTSVAEQWCGRIRTWVSGIQLGAGAYVTDGSHTWKCTNALGFSGASTVAPAAGTGADSITWTDMGTTTTEDFTILAGTGIFPSTSSRWDPNGLVALSIAKSALIKPFVGKMVCLVSIGQQDRYIGTQSYQFADALKKIVTYNLSNGADMVMLGMTVRSSSTVDYSSANGGGNSNAANTTADGWYDNHLIPGWKAALDYFKSDKRVVIGHNWADYIGAVTDQTYATGIGVSSSDHVHMTDATYETLAVPCVDQVFKNNGF